VLQRGGDPRDRLTPSAEHQGERLLAQAELQWLIQPIVCEQEPSRTPLLDAMACVARRRLHRLGEQRVRKPTDQRAEHSTCGKFPSEHVSVESFERSTGHLDTDIAVRSRIVVKRRLDAEDTLAPDGGRFDGRAIRQRSRRREEARARESTRVEWGRPRAAARAETGWAPLPDTVRGG
jgi:hypothetical protein